MNVPPLKPAPTTGRMLLRLGLVIGGLLVAVVVIASLANSSEKPNDATPCSPTPCVTSKEGWTVSVNGVERNLVSPNEFEHPESGNHFVRVGVKVTSSADEEANVSPSNFVLKDSDGVKHSTTSISGVECGWSPVNVAKGGSFGPHFVCFEAQGKPDGSLTLVWTPKIFGRDYSIALP